jgi:hypothetical protein
MLGCDSNFTESKDLAVAIVAERDAITFTIILIKGYEYPSLPGHVIGPSTIWHPTCSIGGVTLQNKFSLCS